MKPKILIADDTRTSRMMMTAAIGADVKESHDIIYAVDGEEAVQQFMDNQPALSFFDLTMPKMNGMEALERILKSHPKAKIVIVTADTQKSTHDKALQLGAIDFINKPISADKIARKMSIWL
ncbi:response regulator [Thiosulfativibrio zosterae]|uniref:Response regulatory domain-containing protein n=1 Tax=Thiosulfativibrio zosterae TaxID=2675053 RepID=A0A6F8PK33_9GAMM|nr:response regulator [Thiosulfativibrio zosterae]BBP42463.1 hypothetical protein THMIRHAT_02090 [Thiosulfativibrio zosterae]